MKLLRRLAIDDHLAVVCVLHQPNWRCAMRTGSSGCGRGQVVFSERPDGLSPRDIGTLYERHAA